MHFGAIFCTYLPYGANLEAGRLVGTFHTVLRHNYLTVRAVKVPIMFQRSLCPCQGETYVVDLQHDL